MPAIFGFGLERFTFNSSNIINLVDNTGAIVSQSSGIGTGRWEIAAAGFGT